MNRQHTWTSRKSSKYHKAGWDVAVRVSHRAADGGTPSPVCQEYILHRSKGHIAIRDTVSSDIRRPFDLPSSTRRGGSHNQHPGILLPEPLHMGHLQTSHAL